MVYGLEYGGESVGFRVSNFEFRVSGFGVWGFEFLVSGLESMVDGSGFELRVHG